MLPLFQARAIDGLFERVAGEHAEDHRHARIELRELDAARRFRRHVIVVRGLAAQHAADANDRIEAAGGGKLLRRNRESQTIPERERFRSVSSRLRRLLKRIERAGEEPVGDEAVELADDDAEVQSRCV